MRGARQKKRARLVKNQLQRHILPVQRHLPDMFEIYSDPVIDIRLDLSDAPIRLVRMTHQHAGFQYCVDITHFESYASMDSKKDCAMTNSTSDLTALIGSRICHDLISPIGAIGNGVELLGMTGAPESPEMELIRQSVENASARIRYFRIAFGSASDIQKIGRTEINDTIKDFFAGSRLQVHWVPQIDCARPDVKMMFLLLLCAETAMPYGGSVRVTLTDSNWHLLGESTKFRREPDLWERVETGESDGVSAAQVHFVLAYRIATEIGRKIRLSAEEGRLGLSA
jgi:histidine phosphotransferase ChpT